MPGTISSYDPYSDAAVTWTSTTKVPKVRY